MAKARKFLVLVQTEAGAFVVGAYGSALRDMADACASKTPGAYVLDCVTDAGAGETLKRLPKPRPEA